MNIWTIGHSNKEAFVIAEAVSQAGVETLIDCRSYGFSKHNPQFNRNRFGGTLDQYGIKYEYRGDNVGGRGENVNYSETVKEIFERAKGGEKICLMCSEGDYKKCHRYYDLSMKLVKMGLEIHHLKPGIQTVIQSAPEKVYEQQGLL